ncbi:MAG: hypothetical protein EXS10_02045 [Phycisphaerales bacterium]|nr:hypothetical protein [Phycisphaerales bacterium]
MRNPLPFALIITTGFFTACVFAQDSATPPRGAEVKLVRELKATSLMRTASADERARALESIRSLRDASSFTKVWRELRPLGLDTNEAFFDALLQCDSAGLAFLTTIAIEDDDPLKRLEARTRLPQNAPPVVTDIVSSHLTAEKESWVNRAAMVASATNAAQLIPQLIDAQSAEGTTTGTGGNGCWIVFGRQTSYIAGLVPVAGDNSGAFQPIPGIIYEGSLLQITDSVVLIYRTEVYTALVTIAQANTGVSMAKLGNNKALWRDWYRDEYPALAAAYQSERAKVEQADHVTEVPDA